MMKNYSESNIQARINTNINIMCKNFIANKKKYTSFKLAVLTVYSIGSY